MYHEVGGKGFWVLPNTARERKSADYIRKMALGPHPNARANKIAAAILVVGGGYLTTTDNLAMGVVLLLMGALGLRWMIASEQPYRRMQRDGRVISLDSGEGDIFCRYVLFGGQYQSLNGFKQQLVIEALPAEPVDAFLRDPARRALLGDIAQVNNPAFRERLGQDLLAKSPDLAAALAAAVANGYTPAAYIESDALHLERVVSKIADLK